MRSLSHVQLNMQTKREKKSGMLSRTSRRSMLRYAYVMYADICICHMLPDGHIARQTHTHHASRGRGGHADDDNDGRASSLSLAQRYSQAEKHKDTF
jgi:hypothetical protein